MTNGSPKPSAEQFKTLNTSKYRGQFGRRGEAAAAVFFQQHGFTILARNWRCRMGEIDLIVEKNKEIRFVEVKTRRTHAYGYPEDAVTPTKLKHLNAAMELWLRSQFLRPVKYQVDVLAITCLADGKVRFHWLEGV